MADPFIKMANAAHILSIPILEMNDTAAWCELCFKASAKRYDSNYNHINLDK